MNNNNKRDFSFYWELSGLAFLGGLVIFFLATSWRRWPDALVDFGVQLYTPWRLAQGEVLHRDVSYIFDFYGPLSQYINAVIFSLFGPGLMILVTANLLIFAAIISVIYILCRRAWGPGAAVAATATFISLFGFSQFISVGNYNFATPYSHEVTHGFLVCLLLILVLIRFVKQATLLNGFFTGFLVGTSAVLKLEIMMSAAVITVAAFLIQFRNSKILNLKIIAAWFLGVIIPTLVFIIYFRMFFPWTESVMAACHAWINIFSAPHIITNNGIYLNFMGFDEPWKNFIKHVYATVVACALIAMIGGTAWLADKCPRKRLLYFFIGFIILFFIWLSWFKIQWLLLGQCLLGLMLIYTSFCVIDDIRSKNQFINIEKQVARLLLALLATAMMARMILQGRIFHFGFYQASLAGLLLPAILIGEYPQRLGMAKWGRTIIIICSLSLLIPGTLKLATYSQQNLHAKNYMVGEGLDMFYSLPPHIDPSGAIVSEISKWLTRFPHSQTLVVLPLGEMINYLARQKNPLPNFCFPPFCFKNESEEVTVNNLDFYSPDRVVIVSVGLSDFDVKHFGEKYGRGHLILQWIAENYEIEAYVGGDPRENKHGGVILKHKKRF